MTLKLWDARLLTKAGSTEAIITVAAPDHAAAWEEANRIAAQATQPLSVSAVGPHRPLIVSSKGITQTRALIPYLRRAIRDGETSHALELTAKLARQLEAIAEDQQAMIDHHTRTEGPA